MPITFNFRAESNLVICTQKGAIPDEELVTSYKSLFDHELFANNMNLLVDLRSSISVPRSTEALIQFGQFTKAHFTKTERRPKIAVVAPNDLTFGLARMYQGHIAEGDFDFATFRAPDTASAWLGVPEHLLDNAEEKTSQSD
jgi:hypothetical protein